MLNQDSSAPSSTPTPGLVWSSAVSSLPSSPGVYWFLDDAGNVLYVGKAKSLKNRVSSYTRLPLLTGKTKKLVLHARRLKFQVLESELEAVLIEAELIRSHQPPYNILLKDDKTPLYIVITSDLYPRVITARKKEIDKKMYKGTIFGPFSSSAKVREVLQIARKIFPWCNGSNNKGKPCFYYHLQLCPGACVEAISPELYAANIEQLSLFLRGKKKDVIKNLEQMMKTAAVTEEYELAAKLRDRITTIKFVTEKTYALTPDLVLPTLKENAYEEGVIQLRRILMTYLNLPKNVPLKRIECYDVSNIQGTNPTVAMVVGIDGKPEPSEYKLFNIRSLNTPNDFLMMKEALTRRQNHPEWGIPDLVVIDGGKGQLRAVLNVWQWQTPVISIAKDPDRLIIPLIKSSKRPRRTQRTLVSDSLEELSGPGHLKIEYEILKLPPDHSALKLVQRLRDEAHRFSKKQHTRMRDKSLFK